MFFFLFLSEQHLPIFTLPDTLFPATTLFRSHWRGVRSTLARRAGRAVSPPSRCTGIDAADAISPICAWVALRSRLLTLKRRRPTGVSSVESTSRITPAHVSVATADLIPPWGDITTEHSNDCASAPDPGPSATRCSKDPRRAGEEST